MLWPTNPTWTDPSEINRGNEYKAPDGIIYRDLNALIHNLIYLKNHGGNGGGNGSLSNLSNGDGEHSIAQVSNKAYREYAAAFGQNTTAGTADIEYESAITSVSRNGTQYKLYVVTDPNGTLAVKSSYTVSLTTGAALMSFGIYIVALSAGSITFTCNETLEDMFDYAENLPWYINIKVPSTSGVAASASGKDTCALADYSDAGGLGTIADVIAQFVRGTYNKRNSGALFAVGNGKSDSERSDAFEVLPDGRCKVGAEPVDADDIATKKYVDSHAGGGGSGGSMSRAELVALIGLASTSLEGLMSAEDKTNLNTLVTFLGEASGDADNIVNTLREVVRIFHNYREDLDLESRLDGKTDASDVKRIISEERPLDDEISDTSSNAVKNHVIKSYVDSKLADTVEPVTICNTKLGNTQNMSYSRLVTSATMSASVAGLNSCIVVVDGTRYDVTLNASGSGSLRVNLTEAVGVGSGYDGIISINGSTLSLSALYYTEMGEDERVGFDVMQSYVSVSVLAAIKNADVAICSDYACIPNESGGDARYEFTLNPALKKGQTLQICLNNSYENLTYPMSEDYGIYTSFGDWVIEGGADWLTVHDHGMSSETVLFSAVIVADSSENGGGNNDTASADTSRVVRVYPGVTGQVFAAAPSKIYYIEVYVNEMGSSRRIEQAIYNHGSLTTLWTEYYSGVYLEYSGSGDVWLNLNMYPSCDWALAVAHEMSSYEDVTCFIEGTEILLRDPVTLETYSKKIEDVKHFDYAAYWMPNLGRLTASRVIAPPIVGECSEYDKLYFSDGTTINVFGVQFFWHADKDKLVNWKTLTPEDRVCTAEGNLVNFVKSEHIVCETPVKHYTLMVFMGKHLANGIQVGDKRELFYPRMIEPARKKYWDKLNEADQRHLIRVHLQGMRRRNWKVSEEYRTMVGPVDVKIAEIEKQIAVKKQYLNDTDYLVTKLMEGVISAEEFAPAKEARQNARDIINEQELILADLRAKRAQNIEEVRNIILSTHVPKFAGKFVGKTRAIIDPE